MRVLLTSFEPFDQMGVNSSLEVGKLLARRPPRGVDLEWLVLPVVAGVCVEATRNLADQMRPDLILCLGQATGATALRLERRAVNCNDFRIPDNAGNEPRNQPIVAGGPAVRTTTTFVHTAARSLAHAGLPVELSDSAGTFVCNHLFYGMLDRTAKQQIQTGFVHLPLLPGQVEYDRQTPALSLEQMEAGIRRIVQTVLEAGRNEPRIISCGSDLPPVYRRS
jgi:pyroglutamyl-peptidase